MELRVKVKEQESQINKLNNQVENLTQAILHTNKKIYGSSSEKTPIAYSIVETAKLNNLDVFQYLNYLFKNLPNTKFKEQPELLAQYLPWSESLPDCCRNKK